MAGTARAIIELVPCCIHVISVSTAPPSTAGARREQRREPAREPPAPLVDRDEQRLLDIDLGDLTVLRGVGPNPGPVVLVFVGAALRHLGHSGRLPRGAPP